MPVLTSCDLISAGVSDGLIERSSVAAPAVCGEAIDVPLLRPTIALFAVLTPPASVQRATVASTLTPGALTSGLTCSNTLGPVRLKSAITPAVPG